MLCGRKKKEAVNLRTELKKPVQFKLAENIGTSTTELNTELFTWDRTLELSEKEKIKEEEIRRALEIEKEEQRRKEMAEEQEILELDRLIQEQNQRLKDLRVKLQDYFKVQGDIKKEYLITEIKNEGLKRMIQNDQKEFLKYADYKFQNQL